MIVSSENAARYVVASGTELKIRKSLSWRTRPPCVKLPEPVHTVWPSRTMNLLCMRCRPWSCTSSERHAFIASEGPDGRPWSRRAERRTGVDHLLATRSRLANTPALSGGDENVATLDGTVREANRYPLGHRQMVEAA